MQLVINISEKTFEEISANFAKLKRINSSAANHRLEEILKAEGEKAIESLLEKMKEVFSKELEQRDDYEEEQSQRLAAFLGDD